jgi:beta-lactam-binding protein with PASTA domain
MPSVGWPGGSPKGKRPYRPPQPGRPLGPQALQLLVIILFVIGSYHLAAWLWARTAPKETTVPSVAGLAQAEAVKVLEAAHLTSEVVARKPSETAPEGTVIAAEPAAGRRVKVGRLISITLSAGSKWAKVPDVLDMSVDRAIALIRQAKLEVRTQKAKYHPKVPTGYVLGQSPAPDTTVPRGSSLDLVVSKGPKPETAIVGEAPPKEEVRSTEISLTVPPGASLQEVRIVVKDRKGERTVYTGFHQPGETVARTVSGEGPTITVQVYLSGLLIEERSL